MNHLCPTLKPQPDACYNPYHNGYPSDQHLTLSLMLVTTHIIIKNPQSNSKPWAWRLLQPVSLSNILSPTLNPGPDACYNSLKTHSLTLNPEPDPCYNLYLYQTSSVWLSIILIPTLKLNLTLVTTYIINKNPQSNSRPWAWRLLQPNSRPWEWRLLQPISLSIILIPTLNPEPDACYSPYHN